MNFHVITLFPEVCQAYTDASVLGRAQKTDKGKGAKVRGKKISVNYFNPRDFTTDKHHKADDRPYGGGPGMVMKAEPILKAWDKAVGRKKGKVKTLIMSPRGVTFDQAMAKELAEKYGHVVLISGRYEGIDARVKEILQAEEVSVGDYVLTGGELPALTIIDAVAREVPGVLGTFESLEDQRVSSGEMYTRPEVLEYKKRKYKVPEVFLSGDHKQINKYRADESAVIKFGHLADDELILFHGESKIELKKRNLIRTSNVTGELGENIVKKIYSESNQLPNIQILPISAENVDAINENGDRYNIKTITNKSTGVIRGLGDRNDVSPKRIFEYLVIVELFPNLQLKRIIELSWEQFLKYKTWHSKSSGWQLTLGKGLLAEAKIIVDKTYSK